MIKINGRIIANDPKDKAKEHKQPAGQTSRELAGLIAAIEAEFDSHIAPDLPGHQNFRKSMIRRALAIVKTQLRQPESPEAALAEAMGYEDISALARAVRARNLCSDQQQILPDRLFAMCAQNWKSPILAF